MTNNFLCRTLSLLIILMSALPGLGKAQTGWQWAAANHGPTIAEAWTIALDSAGNVYSAQMAIGAPYFVFGTDTVHDPGLFDMVMVSKTDPSGNILWGTGTDSTHAIPLGLVSDKQGNSYLLAEYDSSVFVLGSARAVNPTHSKMYALAKLNTSGTVLWIRNVTAYGGLTSSFPGQGSLGLDDSGNVYVCGYYKTATATIGSYALTNVDVTGASEDIFLAKFDPAGNAMWARSYGGRHGDAGTIAVSPAGNVYMTTYCLSDTVYFDATYVPARICLAKTDRNGIVQFARSIAHTGPVTLSYSSVCLDARENVYVAGSLIATHSHFYLTKFDQGGNFRWSDSSTTVTPGGGDGAGGVAVDYCGNVWISGQFTDYFKVGPDTVRTFPGSSDNMFLARFDTAGNYISYLALPIGGDDASGIAVDNKGNLFVGGDYLDYPGGYVIGLDTLTTPTGIEAWFVAKYRYDTVSCIPPLQVAHTSVQHTADEFKVFPNPATDEIEIVSGNEIINEVAISDIYGHIVLWQRCNDHNTTINIKSLPPSIYFARMNGSVVRKFVKE